MSKVVNLNSFQEEEQLKLGITKLGYYDMSSDNDSRQVEIWRILTTLLRTGEGWQANIIPKYDCKNLAPRTHEYYLLVQTREELEGCQEGIREYMHKFYIKKERLERIPIALELEGHLFVLAGNKRVRAHQMAIESGHESLCDLLVLTAPEHFSDHEALDVAQSIALKSNKSINQTRPDTTADHVHQLKAKFQVLQSLRPEMSKWSFAEKEEWARKFLVEEIDPLYKEDFKKAVLGNVIRMAFSDKRATSIPFPREREYKSLFQEFFPRCVFDEQSSEQVLCIKSTTDSIKNSKVLITDWANRPVFTPIQKEAWLILRVAANRGAEITSLPSLRKERKAMLSWLERYNKNPNHIAAGYPLITKVVFVQQLNHGEDAPEAFEWSKQTEELLSL